MLDIEFWSQIFIQFNFFALFKVESRMGYSSVNGSPTVFCNPGKLNLGPNFEFVLAYGLEFLSQLGC